MVTRIWLLKSYEDIASRFLIVGFRSSCRLTASRTFALNSHERRPFLGSSSPKNPAGRRSIITAPRGSGSSKRPPLNPNMRGERDPLSNPGKSSSARYDHTRLERSPSRPLSTSITPSANMSASPTSPESCAKNMKTSLLRSVCAAATAALLSVPDASNSRTSMRRVFPYRS